MSNKMVAGIAFILMAAGFIWGGYYYVSLKPQSVLTETEKLIDSLAEFEKDQLIDIKTTQEVRSLFQDVSHQRIPRIYIANIPADFAQEGSRILFQKMITPLILRENEKLARQRMILQLLNDKKKVGIAWTDREQQFFDQMAVKYDSFLEKTYEGQMNDLLDKVDVIPPALAVVQAAFVTDWGKHELSSPFRQYEWADETHYEIKSFPTLQEAVRSYFFELNSSAPLFEWRYARNQLRSLPNHEKARRVFGFLKQYVPDDPEYSDKLRRQLTPSELDIFEKVSFGIKEETK